MMRALMALLLLCVGTCHQTTRGEVMTHCPAGLSGRKGRDGLSGREGRKGCAGYAGDPGVKGEAGNNSPHGRRGLKGNKGRPGTSRNGVPGLDGLHGLVGLPGHPGDQGSRGDPGVKGRVGDVGEHGQAGYHSRHLRQFTWTGEQTMRRGILKEFHFYKRNPNTQLSVAFSGNIGVEGAIVCSRWYFTLNGSECSEPGKIEVAHYQDTADSMLKPIYFEGMCSGISRGNVSVALCVGPCRTHPIGNARTGFGSSSRIIVEEIDDM